MKQNNPFSEDKKDTDEKQGHDLSTIREIVIRSKKYKINHDDIKDYSLLPRGIVLFIHIFFHETKSRKTLRPSGEKKKSSRGEKQN